MKTALRLTQEQRIATSPTHSVWVRANAGAGKTEVLSQRVIRLLLQGVPPSRLLCLTYTRAAAANMRERLALRLGGWTQAAPEALRQDLEMLTQAPVDEVMLARARGLFAHVLDTPGGLRLQTIHGFADSLLKQFPLEANVPPRFRTLEDPEKNEALERCWVQLCENPTSEVVRDALEILGTRYTEETLRQILVSAMKVEGFVHLSSADLRQGLHKVLGEEAMGSSEAALSRLLALQPDDDEAERLLNVLKPLADAATQQSDVQKTYRALRRWFAAPPSLKSEAWLAVFCGTQPTLKARFLAAKDATAAPEAKMFFDLRLPTFAAHLHHLQTRQLVERTCALHTLTQAFHLLWQRWKQTRGVLDYDDLLQATARLLQSDQAAWVLYKLDQRFDHLLVDEAQDTSPLQWQILGALMAEIGAGQSDARERSVFVVGDEKQSIYSFLGADPAAFLTAKTGLAQRMPDDVLVEQPLSVTYRGTADVLAFVDQVFSNPAFRQGLSSDGLPCVHQTGRRGQRGRVDVWDFFEDEKETPPSAWVRALSPPEGASRHDRLAKALADTIQRWLKSGERLPHGHRAIEAGDILILVRKRSAFSEAINRELQVRGLQVAGADRLDLLKHLACKDMLAIGRFLVVPDDDLNLAALLKSPLVGLHDDHLLVLTQDPALGFSLLDVLKQRCEPPYTQALARLQAWQDLAATHTPYDFYAHLWHDPVQQRHLLSTFGPEVVDVMHEWLALVLHHEAQGHLTHAALSAQLQGDSITIKRDMEAQGAAIRVMTVHGAKGLEAPIVFVVDDGSKPTLERHPFIAEVDGVFLLAESQFAHLEPVGAGREAQKRLLLEEYHRQFYVAMTRAADWLILCGYKGSKAPQNTWLAMAHATVETHKEAYTTVHLTDTFACKRYEATPAEAQIQANRQTSPSHNLPSFLHKPLPALYASRPVADVTSLTGGMAALRTSRSRFDRSTSDAARRRQEGTWLHRAFAFWPDEERAQRALSPLDEASIHEWMSHFRWLAEHPSLLPFFGACARAEVPLTGVLLHHGHPTDVHGRVDRLYVETSEVGVLDLKTGSPSPTDMAQVRLYMGLLTACFPHHRVRGWLAYPAVRDIVVVHD